MRQVDFACARARLQARHGGLPDGATWRALEASHTPGHYLALARTGPLAPWLAGLPETSDPHRLEAQLRARWQAYVAEVAGWQPPAWQAAIRWFGTLPAWSEWPESPESPDRPQGPAANRRLGRASAARWLEAWQRLMPRQPEAATRLRQVATLLMPRLQGVTQGAVQRDKPGATDGRATPAMGRPAVPEAERLALVKLFRRGGASPVAAVAHLALVALDLERLRGGIVVRLLLGPPQVPAPSAEAGAGAAAQGV